MTIGPMPACYACARLRQNADCEAFPVSIPEAIWLGSLLHTTPVAGDSGLTYSPVEGFTLNADGSIDGPDGLRWEPSAPEGVTPDA